MSPQTSLPATLSIPTHPTHRPALNGDAIPTEVLYQIFNHLLETDPATERFSRLFGKRAREESISALLAVAKVCRKFYDVALPLYYSHVEIITEADQERVETLAERWTSSKENWFRYTKKLNFQYSKSTFLAFKRAREHSQGADPSITASEIEMSRKLTERSLRTLRPFENIVSLSLRVDGLNFDHYFHLLKRVFEMLPKLKDLELGASFLHFLLVDVTEAQRRPVQRSRWSTLFGRDDHRFSSSPAGPWRSLPLSSSCPTRLRSINIQGDMREFRSAFSKTRCNPETVAWAFWNRFKELRPVLTELEAFEVAVPMFCNSGMAGYSAPNQVTRPGMIYAPISLELPNLTTMTIGYPGSGALLHCYSPVAVATQQRIERLELVRIDAWEFQIEKALTQLLAFPKLKYLHLGFRYPPSSTPCVQYYEKFLTGIRNLIVVTTALKTIVWKLPWDSRGKDLEHIEFRVHRSGVPLSVTHPDFTDHEDALVSDVANGVVMYTYPDPNEVQWWEHCDKNYSWQ